MYWSIQSRNGATASTSVEPRQPPPVGAGNRSAALDTACPSVLIASVCCVMTITAPGLGGRGRWRRSGRGCAGASTAAPGTACPRTSPRAHVDTDGHGRTDQRRATALQMHRHPLCDVALRPADVMAGVPVRRVEMQDIDGAQHVVPETEPVLQRTGHGALLTDRGPRAPTH